MGAGLTPDPRCRKSAWAPLQGNRQPGGLARGGLVRPPAVVSIAPMDDTSIRTPEPVRAHRVAWVILALVLIALGLWTLREFLAALAWASILAVAFWPSSQRSRRHWPPGRHDILLPALFTAAIALAFVLPIVLAGMQAGKEARTVFAWIDSARHDGLPVPDILGHLPFIAGPATLWWQ